MNQDFINEIKKFFSGDIESKEEILQKYSVDASLFSVTPELVVYPKNTEDISKLTAFVNRSAEHGLPISLTVRAAGTCMSGGPLNKSIIVDTTRYLNKIISVNSSSAVVEPGVFYRDFEKETLKYNAIMPTFPASRELCAVGGMVANNSGGEKSLVYGKTSNFVRELEVVLSDGTVTTIKKLTKLELEQKTAGSNFESKVYKQIFDLILSNQSEIQNQKPIVSKNSAGYNLWDVWNGVQFDLPKLFVGSQGTLGIITKITFDLVPVPAEEILVTVFLKDLKDSAKLVNEILTFKPESIESYDDNALKLVFKFFNDMRKRIGSKNIVKLGFQFLPELLFIIRYGVPKLVILIEFTGKSREEVLKKANNLYSKLKTNGFVARVVSNKDEAKKYWTIRHESFNLFRQKVKGLNAAPFVDDVIVKPEYLPEFFPQMTAILDKYKFFYTVTGHPGNGNFHIIPLVDLKDPEVKTNIMSASEEVYDLVGKYHGSITAEHNDGIMKTPFLDKMFSKKMLDLFLQTKKIFDPNNIFNPGKKVNGSKLNILQYMKKG